MQIVISGATGYVGGQLLELLFEFENEDRHEIDCLTRNPAQAAHTLSRFRHARALEWDPMATQPSKELVSAIEQADCLVHLAGEQVVGTRLTEAKKEKVRRSRIESTRLLTRAMERAQTPPRTFLCASGIHYYGDHEIEEELDESAPAGSGFMARICIEWEKAAEEASSLGVRVIRSRFGVVLGKDGGALEKMALPIRLFVGGRLGSGKQVVSWIHQRDTARALLHCLQTDSIRGPVNFAAPHAVTNEQLTRAIGEILGRPTPFAVPSLALRLLLAEGAEPLLTGPRAIPKKLLDSGFQFEYPELGDALHEALGDMDRASRAAS